VGSEDTLSAARRLLVRCVAAGRRLDLLRRLAVVRRLLPTAHCSRHTVFVLLLTAHCTLLTASCRRDMQDQPKMKPYRSSTFFRDGLSARPPIEGTVARGFLKTDTEFFTGKKAGRAGATASISTATAASTAAGETAAGSSSTTASTSATGTALQGAAAYPDDVELFPIAVTKEVISRGKERYEIFCSACHGLTGNGDGMIVRRGFRRASSFNDDRLRQAPVGHFFDAITNGWGAMPSYAPQIPPEDRWAIIAYIRALQLAQQTEAPAGSASPTAGATPAQSGGHR
jgi:mono/diheme cytochrome c family protein